MQSICTGVYISIPPFAAFPIHRQLTSSEVSKKKGLHATHMYKKLSSVQPPVRTCTRSRIFTPVADVLQKYLCTRINPVFISIDCVHILIDVERKRKAVQECHIEIAPQRIPCSPAHHQGSPKILQRTFIATNSRHIAHANKNSHIQLHVVRIHPHQRHANSRW